MFISKKEKDLLTQKIAKLELSMHGVAASLRIIEENILVLREKTKKVKKAKKPMSPEQRAKQREYAKRYNEKKKAEKAAKLAQVVA